MNILTEGLDYFFITATHVVIVLISLYACCTGLRSLKRAENNKRTNSVKNYLILSIPFSFLHAVMLARWQSNDLQWVIWPPKELYTWGFLYLIISFKILWIHSILGRKII